MNSREQPHGSFGDWLRQHRRALDLTQAELARQEGCSAITLRKLEAEERRPSKQTAERLAEALQVPPDDRADFLRFARGDPFAAPEDSKAPNKTDEQPTPRHNLKLQLTSFIGRENEIDEVRHLLATARLVTLTGAGGSGKSRLALQVAAGLLDAAAFPDGVWLVELAPLADPALVPQVVATTFGLKEQAGQPLMDMLLHHLRARRLLLVLDNCEHLIQACAELAEVLLRASASLTVIVTSREALSIPGETTFPVPTLSSPDTRGAKSVEALTQYDAVLLFVERAQAALMGFNLTSANASAVARICQQLDGIPLAIELAAARTRVLGVDELAARLKDRFQLLTSGSRTALPRHQTLRALIDWSYDLLSEPERRLLRRLAVFAGGWTLPAAESVCTGRELESSEVLALLAQLVNKSLVTTERKPDAEVRYWLLETIRQYAAEKLEASGDGFQVNQQHAAFYLALADSGYAITSSSGPEPEWYDQVRSEYDNLRAALIWTQSAVGRAELALQLVKRLSMFWWRRGTFSEARLWFEGALAVAGPENDPPAQAEIHRMLGLYDAQLGDYVAGQAHLERSWALLRDQQDHTRSAYALRMLGWMARERGDAATARLHLEESVKFFRDFGDKEHLADGLITLGEVAVMLKDAAWATTLIEEGLALWRELDDPDGIGWSLNHLGHVAQLRGEYARARRLHEESLSLFRGLDAQYYGLAWAHQGLGEAALGQGDAALAATDFREALTLSRDAGYRAGMAWCLAGLAGVAFLDEDPERAARLWGGAEALRQSIGAREAPASHATRERLMAAAREQLGETAFAEVWSKGQAMTMEDAIALAIKDE